MKPEAQRIAIAEACGWVWTNLCPTYGPQSIRFWLNTHTNKTVSDDDRLPDYLNDLNAMHEAERVFGTCSESWQKYRLRLYGIIEVWRDPVNATAAQRAEAFLRTLGLWEDDK